MMFTIDNKITELRTQRKVTQEELAGAVGVSRQTMSALEKGSYVPSLVLAMQISNYFQMKVEEVFTLTKLSAD